jgi:hypothetical protein
MCRPARLVTRIGAVTPIAPLSLVNDELVAGNGGKPRGPPVA